MKNIISYTVDMERSRITVRYGDHTEKEISFIAVAEKIASRIAGSIKISAKEVDVEIEKIKSGQELAPELVAELKTSEGKKHIKSMLVSRRAEALAQTEAMDTVSDAVNYCVAKLTALEA